MSDPVLNCNCGRCSATSLGNLVICYQHNSSNSLGCTILVSCGGAAKVEMDSPGKLKRYETDPAANSSANDNASTAFQLVDISYSSDSGYDADIEIRHPDEYEEPSSPFSESGSTPSTATPNDVSDIENRLSAGFSNLQCDPSISFVSAPSRYRTMSEAPQAHRKRISGEISGSHEPESMRSSAPPEASSIHVIDLRDNDPPNLRQVKRLRKSVESTNRSRLHRRRDSHRAGSALSIRARSASNGDARKPSRQTTRDECSPEAMDLG